MPLESCMILLDCSEYMRNGDYVPSRLEAQVDAANLLAGAKTQAHPESTVGVSAGNKVLLSPTDNVGKILSAIHTTKGGGDFRSASMNGPLELDPQVSDVAVSVQVAGLALKHRPNKNGSQRIVLFVGSPIEAEKKALQKAGRQLKKNNVAIDVVALGELEENEPKLRELVDAANGRTDDSGERTCHLVTIPPGVLPSDVLANSPILGAGGAFAGQAAVAMASGGGGGGDGGFADFGGIDPNMDPELAMALRISMEEERARQERAAAASNAEGGGGGASNDDANMTEANTSSAAAEAGMSEEEALLQQALAMSMNENEPASAEDSKPAAESGEGGDEMEMDEDEAMQMALQMSMQQQQDQDGSGGGSLQDPSFVNQLLGSAQGVDANDPEIQEALRKSKEEKDKKEESKKE
uniref:VWFA domain-containing protein n=1 Tax=Amphora coffeiformis TaxID=265554 RepID=A0A7S3LEP2_9STRA|mmetsp:Transcript_6828/g.13136  ORF Transcript_6828/g.13136 Transcript_6828/m.13136 type:complete len:411 (+) Transcript_6828:130-1362(+)